MRLTLLGTLLVAIASLAEAETPPKYSLRAGLSLFGPGSSSQAKSAGIPFDRTYAELTPGQKQIVKSQYVDMGDADEPPFPRDGLGPLHESILRGYAGLSRYKIEGEIDLEMVVDPTGKAIEVKVFKASDERLWKMVAYAASRVPYKPAICGGTPCKMNFPVRITFVLE